MNIIYTFKVNFLTINYARERLGKFQIRANGHSDMIILYKMMKGSYKVML